MEVGFFPLIRDEALRMNRGAQLFSLLSAADWRYNSENFG